jgi:hypothetical protein
MKFNYLILFALWLSSCTPIPQSSSNSASNPKALQLIDKAYEPQIKTVLLYPDGAPQLPPVIQFGHWNLILQFDDLAAQNDTYYARIEHCNHNWTASSLQDLDFMPTYNEFPINNFEFSLDTHIPYVHYWMTVPAVKLPGNYVLVVYRGGNKEDIVLTRRFMVFDPQITFKDMSNLIGAGSIANVSQQLNFTVKYTGLDILNPLIDVHVNVRQNQRWDNMAADIKPSFVRDIEKELEYRFFDESQIFKGGNEFRFFDLRSLNYPGRNVASINKSVKPFEAFIDPDKTRNGQAYAQYNDLNGNFRLDNYDYRSLAYSNYVNVNFTLNSPPVDGDVYVTGAFNYWALNDVNRMHYDSASNQYKLRTMLKQGWYDYQYLVRSSTLPPYYFEGSHFESENYYEIFVYYRPFKPQADLLVGYLLQAKNPR